MALSLIFLLLLVLPGFAVVCWCFREELESGILGTIAVSYVATLALLTPVSIVGYLLGLPVAIFTAFALLLIGASVVLIIRRGWWRDAVSLVRSAAWLEAGIILANVGVSLAVGARLKADAAVHLTRISYILDHGFSNADPYIGADTFFTIYHTNLYHALVAAATQAGGTTPYDAWFAALGWAQLVIPSAMFYLAWSLTRNKWAGWLAALAVLGARGWVDFLVYPNQVTPYFLVTMAFAFAAQTWRTDPQGTPGGDPSDVPANLSWRNACKILCVTLVAGQFHGLYAAFAAMVTGPAIALRALLQWRITRKPPKVLLACLLALLPALAFPLVTEMARTGGGGGASPGAPSAIEPMETRSNLIELGGGMVMRDPFRGFGARGGYRYVLLAISLVALGVFARRREAIGVAVMAGTICTALFIPPVTTKLLEVLRAPWVLDRLFELIRVLYIAAVPAAIGVFLMPRLRYWWARSGVSVGVLLVSILIAGGASRREQWGSYLATAISELQSVGSSAEEGSAHYTYKQMYIERSRFFREMGIAPGSTILVDPDTGQFLCSAFDLRIVLPRQGGMGIPDRRQRADDLAAMLTPSLPWEDRSRLLRKYGIRYYWPTDPRLLAQIKPHARRDVYDQPVTPRHRVLEIGP